MTENERRRTYEQRYGQARPTQRNAGGQRASQRGDAARYSDRSRYTGQQRHAERQVIDDRERYAAQRRASGQGVSGQARARQEHVRQNRPTSRAQYANARQGAPGPHSAARYNDPSRYTSAAGGYNSLYDPRGAATPAQKSNAPKIVAIVIGVIAIAALLWFFVIPKPFDVTVNGKEVTVNPGATVATLVEEGHARPIPGNLVAVDGSLITAGEGEPFSATVNGKAAATDAALSAGMTVEIDDGGDITEDFTATEEVVPFPTVNDDMSFEAYWAGSIHEMKDGEDGLRTVKTGAISGKTVTEDTKPAVAGGYHNYTVQTDEPVIALTFDDGPWPETTDQILDILEANGAKATFFTIGNQVEPYAAAAKRANDMGCEVVTHSWDHADGSGNGVDLTLMSAEEQIAEIQQGYAAIKNVLGTEPVHLLRAPGGNFHDDIINTLWPYVDAEIGWDVDTEDWARPGVDAIVARILSVEPGQVILMHDGGGDRSQTVEALRIALPTLIERGFKCVTVSELLTYDTSHNAAAATAEPAEQAESAEMAG